MNIYFNYRSNSNHFEWDDFYTILAMTLIYPTQLIKNIDESILILMLKDNLSIIGLF